ncbi:MAG: adventurous gliding motility protein CglE [Deltaproteobacteria bacterium]|nr:adventurous gliding motility protein CglE [Deltaproteobacteria bacterium]
MAAVVLAALGAPMARAQSAGAAGSKDAKPASGIAADKTAAGSADLVDRSSKDSKASANLAAQAPVEETAIPANGVDPRPRRGTYADLALGFFTTLGGQAGVSNGQPFLSMTVGRDFNEVGAVFLSLGIGASSANCFDNYTASTGACSAADSFGAFYLEGGLQYGVELANRLRLLGKLVVGATQLAPGPVANATDKSVPDSLLGFHGGLGASLDYDTRLDHFAVGIDIMARYTMASRPDSGSFGLVSLAAMPRIRYVF